MTQPKKILESSQQHSAALLLNIHYWCCPPFNSRREQKKLMPHPEGCHTCDLATIRENNLPDSGLWQRSPFPPHWIIFRDGLVSSDYVDSFRCCNRTEGIDMVPQVYCLIERCCSVLAEQQPVCSSQSHTVYNSPVLMALHSPVLCNLWAIWRKDQVCWKHVRFSTV